jgi:hypothetical protein
MEGRNQFTFYRSFAEALRYIRKPAERALAYDAICNYALYGVEPNLDELPDSAALAMAVIKPILDSGNRKAKAGQQGGSKPKANDKQTESKPKANASNWEANGKQEKEQEKEQEQDKEQMLIKRCDPKQEAFERFWAVYPKKVGKEAARRAFLKVKVPTDTLITAISAQKRSAQWTKENGQYIPNPATWLNQGRWEDVLETPVEPDTSGWTMGAEELAAINAMKRRRANNETDRR